MVLRNPPLAEPVKYPGGVKSKPPFEMGVANFNGDLVRLIRVSRVQKFSRVQKLKPVHYGLIYQE